MKKIIAGVITAALTLSATVSAASDTFNANQTQQIHKIIRSYLLKNPDILIEMSASLQKKKMQDAQSAANQAIDKNKDNLFSSTNAPVYGNPKGSIYLVEFFDYQCGHCKEMSPVIDNIIKKNKEVKVISRNFPIFGKNSLYAAQCSIAAYLTNKDKYYPLHKALMASDDPMSNDTVNALLKKYGYDVKSIQKLATSTTVKKQIANNYLLAKALRLEGTPALIITNAEFSKFRFIPGATPEPYLQKAINSVL